MRGTPVIIVSTCLASQLRALADLIDPPPPASGELHGIAEQARRFAERITGEKP